MGYQIIKQPDEQFAVFCTVTDTIILWDGTADEIVEWFAARAAEQARRDARQTIAHVAAGEPRRAYFQFAMTWQKALEEDREHGGDAWRHFTESTPGDRHDPERG